MVIPYITARRTKQRKKQSRVTPANKQQDLDDNSDQGSLLGTINTVCKYIKTLQVCLKQNMVFLHLHKAMAEFQIISLPHHMTNLPPTAIQHCLSMHTDEDLT